MCTQERDSASHIDPVYTFAINKVTRRSASKPHAEQQWTADHGRAAVRRENSWRFKGCGKEPQRGSIAVSPRYLAALGGAIGHMVRDKYSYRELRTTPVVGVAR